MEGHKYIRREGESGHYVYTYADTTPTGEHQGQKVVMMTPLAEEAVGDKARELEAYTREELDMAYRRLQAYTRRLPAGQVPANIDRWIRAVHIAISRKPAVAAAPVAAPAPLAPAPTPAPAPVVKPEAPKLVIPAQAPVKRRNKKKPEQIVIDFNKTAAAAIAENPVAQAMEDAKHMSDDPPAPVPEMKAVEVKPKGKAEPEGSTLVQTGDHIWGSRKDLADLQKIERADQLDGMSYDDAAYLVRKKNLVPTHDLNTLRGLGHDPMAAHMALALLSTIQSKPADTDKDRRLYVEACHNVVESVLNAKTGEQMEVLCQELGHKVWREDTRDIQSYLGYERADAMARAEAHIESLKRHNPGKDYETQWVWGSYGPAEGVKVVEVIHHPHAALGERFFRFVQRRGADWKAARHMGYYLEEAEKSKPGSGWELLEKKGQEKELEQAAKQAKIAERKGKKKTEEDYSSWRTREVPEEVKRQGGRRIENPDPKRIKETFNLREVDYGQRGWMSEKDREYHTARLEEAFTDFADVLGVDPQTVSFNGRLGVALGARGRGKAAAHYETGRAVINITKFNGGGSLAHEWGHALDNIMASVHLGNKEGRGQGVYLSETHNVGAGRDLPDDVKSAMRDVWNAITDHPNPQEAQEKHYALKRKLRDRVDGLVKQNNDLVHEYNNLSRKPLASELPKRQAEIQRYIDHYTKRYVELTEKGKLRAAEQKEVQNLEFWINRKRKDMETISDPANFRTEADTARMADIKTGIEDLRLDINNARKDLSKHANTDPSVSHYYASAVQLGEYWSRTVELFARAFEGYVEDKLAKRKMVSTYLVSGTNKKTWSTGKETAHGPATPYPQGEERANIYTKMDALMGVLIKGGHLKKALEWLERIG